MKNYRVVIRLANGDFLYQMWSDLKRNKAFELATDMNRFFASCESDSFAQSILRNLNAIVELMGEEK